nr:hypothetical protein [Tanacetum cinerariifolium]
MNDIVSSDEEWEESDYGNPPNTTTDSSFKPYLNAQEKDDTKKEDERIQKKRKGNNNILNKPPKSDNQNNKQPSERVCKAKKFEAIKYSLGPNEEYIAIRSCEYNTWERNEHSVSYIYQDVFKKKEKGWTMTLENIDGYRDQDMGDVIFREPFCKALCVEERRFDG